MSAAAGLAAASLMAGAPAGADPLQGRAPVLVHTCQFGGNERSIRVFEGAGGKPCRADYEKPGSVQTGIYSGDYTRGYCRQRSAELATKLEAVGWVCTVDGPAAAEVRAAANPAAPSAPADEVAGPAQVPASVLPVPKPGAETVEAAKAPAEPRATAAVEPAKMMPEASDATGSASAAQNADESSMAHKNAAGAKQEGAKQEGAKQEGAEQEIAAPADNEAAPALIGPPMPAQAAAEAAAAAADETSTDAPAAPAAAAVAEGTAAEETIAEAAAAEDAEAGTQGAGGPIASLTSAARAARAAVQTQAGDMDGGTALAEPEVRHGPGTVIDMADCRYPGRWRNVCSPQNRVVETRLAFTEIYALAALLERQMMLDWAWALATAQRDNADIGTQCHTWGTCFELVFAGDPNKDQIADVIVAQQPGGEAGSAKLIRYRINYLGDGSFVERQLVFDAKDVGVEGAVRFRTEPLAAAPACASGPDEPGFSLSIGIYAAGTDPGIRQASARLGDALKPAGRFDLCV